MGLIQYLKETKAEMSKVKWPTRRETVMYTFLVIAISLGTALILGAFDFGFTRVVEQLLA